MKRIGRKNNFMVVFCYPTEIVVRCLVFTIYHSNQVDVLKSLLVELIRLNPLQNPFDSEQILVQSPGMSQWLKMEMAQEFGVAANLTFPLPATFIWDMFTKVLTDVPKRSAFNKEAMTWKLMQLLPLQLEQPEFAPLKQYLQDDTDQSKCYQLAEKIADTFDGYLVYRPEWIATWEAGEVVDELDGEHPWQPLLWQALYDQTVALGQSPYHRANLYDHFIETLDTMLECPQGLPPRLFVFGITALPPRYMDALHALGKHIDVHLMFTNPCRFYWGDIKDRKYLAKLEAKNRQKMHWLQDRSELGELVPQLKGSIEQNAQQEWQQLHTEDAVGNSLLASMGKLGRDNLYLLSQLEANEIDAFVDIQATNLLQHIQADILELHEHQDDEKLETSVHKPVIEQKDSSFQLHVCHSPMREVEVLHDRLLAMFDADPSIKPRDIIVMVADINAYSHAIQAVFGNAPNERFIPYSISDRSVDQENPILQAFMNLLALPKLRCQASELLELLEVPAVMARFGIKPEEFERVTSWVEQVGIRWGLDERTAQQFELPDQKNNTWLFGIERMLLGYAISEQAGLYDGFNDQSQCVIAPFDEAQGMDAELAGKLAEVVSRLQHYRDLLIQTQSFADWQHCLFTLLDDFFLVDLEGESVLTSIRHCLQQLQQQLEDACVTDDISPQVLEQYLMDHLSSSKVSQRFLAGQVNFCTLMPMRSIPFKTVCLLGMNDGLYPRSVNPESFDLIAGRTRPGDRSRRDDDRYLFLEALQSAQQTLYISYVGRSIQDNSDKEPSVLVAELLEYCQQNYALSGSEHLPSDESGLAVINAIRHQHPLVPFSPSAFAASFDGKDAAIASYAKEWLPVAKSQQLQGSKAENRLNEVELDPYISQLEPDHLGVYSLDLQSLQRFWRLPVRYFFNQRLKSYFDDSGSWSNSLDDEPFSLNGLESYQLSEHLLQSWLEAQSDRHDSDVNTEFTSVAERFIAEKKAQGKLPLAEFGQLASQQLMSKVEPLTQSLSQLTKKPLEDIEIDLAINIELDGVSYPHKIVGWLNGLYASADQPSLVRYRTGSLHCVTMMSCWLEHLCMNASGYTQTSDLLGLSNKEGLQHIQFNAMDQNDALNQLTHLVGLYYQGLNSPLWFVPKTAMAGVETGFLKSNWGSADSIWVGLDSPEAQEIATKVMEKTFQDGYTFAGEGRDDYIQRIWKQWTPDLADELLELGVGILKPMLDQVRKIQA